MFRRNITTISIIIAVIIQFVLIEFWNNSTCFTEIICNKFLANKWKEHLIIIPSFILYPVIRLNNSIAKKLKFSNSHKIILKPFDTEGVLSKTKPTIKFTKKEIFFAENKLYKNNINFNKIVCLIVRDSEYLKQKFPSQDFSYHDYRDCEIDNYIETVKYLNDNGITVIRMGRVVKKKMSYKNKLFIEYSGSEIESDFMDIFLGYKCLFGISSGTGWEAVPAFLFRKPMVFTNFSPFGQLITTSNVFVNLAKKHYSNKLKKYLCVSDIFKLCAFDFEEYKKNNITIEENTSKELRDAVGEMLNNIINCKTYSDQENNLNSMFWKLYKKNILNEDGGQKTWLGVKCHQKEMVARYSISFLKNNPDFIN